MKSTVELDVFLTKAQEAAFFEQLYQYDIKFYGDIDRDENDRCSIIFTSFEEDNEVFWNLSTEMKGVYY